MKRTACLGGFGLIVALAWMVAGCGDDGGSGYDVPDAPDVEEEDGDVRPDTDARPDADGDADADAAEDGDVGPEADGDAPCLCAEDIECQDDNTCNGAEQCVDCACAAGIPPVDGTSCSDGDPCTEDEFCAAGACGGGTAICTCATDDDCLAYDDGDLCNGRPTCTGGVCAFDPETVVTCDTSGDTDCLVSSCDADTGECGPAPVADGSACDDGNACTSGELCAAGVCAGGAPSCECTVDDDCAAFEDDDLCNGTLHCLGSTCVLDPATIVVCDPAGDTDCQASRCDAATGACSLADRSDGTTCDDGDPCTIGDACDGGACGGTARACDDGNACTDDSCNPTAGCVFTPNMAVCNDGNACTTGDTCTGGVCGGAARTCDDGNGCTDDSCDAATGCVFTANTAACDDGDPCTISDVCGGGVCAAGTARSCDDGSVCTNDSCDPALGCVFTPNTAACDDGDACTTGDTCGGGVCAGTTTRSCDDGNVCTADSCDAALGCVFAFNTVLCNDGNACTTGDVCGSGTCAGTLRTCDDGNVCTDDSCDPASGSCVAANNSAACSDGDPCTTSDYCGGGICHAGPGLPSWYPDADGDTYGDARGTAICAATAPAGYAAEPTDCCDTLSNVNPGQTAYFPTAYTCGSSSSYDYNCDTVPELRWAVASAGCTHTGTTCTTTIGWMAATPRSCGSNGSFVTACDSSCRVVSETRTQECR
jgi:hypothetical protein